MGCTARRPVPVQELTIDCSVGIWNEAWNEVANGLIQHGYHSSISVLFHETNSDVRTTKVL